jgi:phenylalanyl-tRNA synthetase beta chain
MTLSYNWLCDYLPETMDPEVLSGILTSIGLEVESLEKFEAVKGGLKGLVAGEVITCEKHPEADKLKLTTVNIGLDTPLNIVCGAPNVAVGQKVIVAPIGCTIYPVSGDPITLKKAKIRGAESQGMICAEDEIGVGESHDGIKILPEHTIPGTPIADLLKPHEDYIYEIGLTPNRMDAMSHLGVARDVCAYLTYHHKKQVAVKLPFSDPFAIDESTSDIKVSVENSEACMRYCGIVISGVNVTESPAWLQEKIKSIGLKPINNIVDITNFILHETGQPLHAFDAAKISGNKVIVKTVEEGTLFKTLDEKDRKLLSTDLMICNASEPMCIAGVYGGINSGVTASTTQIFLESACFDKGFVRRTSLKHELKTDAATRFEKGVDISNTATVLKRAALMIKEIAGGSFTSELIDIYPNPKNKTILDFHFSYLKKLSGKEYQPTAVKSILLALGFEILQDNNDFISLAVPYSKSDISIQADIVEEIMRIDGLDNIEIPHTISIAPAIEKSNRKFALKEKLANTLVGWGFNEIFTNSISNSAFYDEALLSTSVKMMNSLSNDLDMLRPQMIQSGLQVIAHNINRKNNNLRLFENGKTYFTNAEKEYQETNHLVLYVTGGLSDPNWKTPVQKADFFYLKGVVDNILTLSGIKKVQFESFSDDQIAIGSNIISGKTKIGTFGEVSEKLLKKFDIKHAVYFADIDMDQLLVQKTKPVQYKELSKFPSVNRDLALIVDKSVTYAQIEQIALSSKIEALTGIHLFDIFESDKLGAGKKSMAVSFTFLDETKTLTDKEIDGFMQKIISGCEKTIQAEIRK